MPAPSECANRASAGSSSPDPMGSFSACCEQKTSNRQAEEEEKLGAAELRLDPQTRTEGVNRDMRHHTVSATFSAPANEMFDYLADLENLSEWATEFARELQHVDGRHKAVNGLGEFFFELHADPGSGVIDMLAGPREETLQLFPTRV